MPEINVHTNAFWKNKVACMQLFLYYIFVWFLLPYLSFFERVCTNAVVLVHPYYLTALLVMDGSMCIACSL